MQLAWEQEWEMLQQRVQVMNQLWDTAKIDPDSVASQVLARVAALPGQPARDTAMVVMDNHPLEAADNPGIGVVVAVSGTEGSQ